MEKYEEIFRMNFSTKTHPQKMVYAHCSRCGNEVDSFAWRTAKDRLVKRMRLKSKTRMCPYCKARYQ